MADPRWASWNLGIFICIRCSGIHRGMGTHISRVKSVDLDAWTDDQLQSVLRWGNGRANKYWEAKLAPGHVPSDSKIENFIRTKYESKRWVMEGPMPDPSTLDDGGGGDDNVPLNVVREKAQLDRSASQRAASASGQASFAAPQRQPAPSFDLIGSDDPAPPPPRPSTTDTPAAATRAPPQARTSTPSQLLGGLDFLGAPSDRSASAGSTPPGMSRPDLKQSILSLYASGPSNPPSASAAQESHTRQPSSFGGMTSPPTSSSSASFGGMSDAFAGLNFGGNSSAPPTARPLQPSQPTPVSPAAQQSRPNYAAFSAFSPSTKTAPAAPQITSPPLSGGGFFDAGPKPPPKPTAPKSNTAPALAVRKISNASDGFGDFSSAMNAAPAASSTNNTASNNSGLLDFTKTPLDIKPPTPQASKPQSVFNLSSNSSQPPSQTAAPSGKVNYASKVSTDPWGGNEWAVPDPAPAPAREPSTASIPVASGNDFGWGSSGNAASSAMQNEWSQPAAVSNAAANPAGGWGAAVDNAWSAGTPAQPKVAAEEDFGAWGSATAPAQPAAPAQPQAPAQQPKSFAPGEDLFSNVWG